MPKCGSIASNGCKKLKLFEPKQGKNYQKYPIVIAIDQHWWKISKSKPEKQGKKYQNANSYDDMQWSMNPNQNPKNFFFKMN